MIAQLSAAALAGAATLRGEAGVGMVRTRGCSPGRPDQADPWRARAFGAAPAVRGQWVRRLPRVPHGHVRRPCRHRGRDADRPVLQRGGNPPARRARGRSRRTSWPLAGHDRPKTADRFTEQALKRAPQGAGGAAPTRGLAAVCAIGGGPAADDSLALPAGDTAHPAETTRSRAISPLKASTPRPAEFAARAAQGHVGRARRLARDTEADGPRDVHRR